MFRARVIRERYLGSTTLTWINFIGTMTINPKNHPKISAGVCWIGARNSCCYGCASSSSRGWKFAPGCQKKNYNGCDLRGNTSLILVPGWKGYEIIYQPHTRAYLVQTSVGRVSKIPSGISWASEFEALRVYIEWYPAWKRDQVRTGWWQLVKFF